MLGYFEQYNLVAASGLFDESFYLKNNTDVAVRKIDPLSHYIEYGARELRDPGPEFDAHFYIEQCHFSGDIPENPLVHYLTIGINRGFNRQRQKTEKTFSSQGKPTILNQPASEHTEEAIEYVEIQLVHLSSSGLLTVTGSIASNSPLSQANIYWNNQIVSPLSEELSTLDIIPNTFFPETHFILQGEIGPQEDKHHHLRLVLRTLSHRLDDIFLRVHLTEETSDDATNTVAAIESEQPIKLFVDRPPPSECDRLIPCSGDLEIVGWCITDAGIDSLTVLLNSEYMADVYRGVAREDVRAAFPDREDALRSGFEARIPRRDLLTGEHSVIVRVIDNDGAQCSASFRIQVAEAPNADEVDKDLHYAEAGFRLEIFIRYLESTIDDLSRPRSTKALDRAEHLKSCLSLLRSLSETFFTTAKAQGAAALDQLSGIMRCLGNFPGGILGDAIAADDDERLKILLQRYRQITFAKHPEADVSIVIPAFNNFFFTYQCLSSIRRNLPRARLQIIVVDDCSVDETVLLKRIVHGVTILRNTENRGFVESCNLGARAATAPYIMLLNNDTQVTAGAVDALLETLQEPNTGFVGSKLVYPDGRLQEAGGIIWRNGTGWNYGRLEHPDHPYYSYRRPVDYCSGASIMLPLALWNQLGGFDVRYNPAYYEDVDLAFRVREAGYEVLYQPASVVIHWEGISNGKVPNTGVKACQIRNEPVFRARWAAALQTRAPRGEQPLLARDRGVEKRALFIDATTPTPDQDAGSTVALAHMQILQLLGYKVTFIPAHNFAYMTDYTPGLQRIGIEAIYGPAFTRLDRFLEERGNEFDLAYVHRFEVGEVAIPLLRRHAPRARILFNTADLHHLRLERGARLTGSNTDLEQAQRVKERELAVIAAADCTLVCNTHEIEIVQRELPSAALHYLPWVIEVERRPLPDFDTREGFMFLGGFGHPPNEDAVRYFISEIMPIVRQLLPGVPFHVYGSKLPDALWELAAPDVILEGFAPDLRAAFDRHRVMVAPLRYGAGFKGKVASSLANGVPVVASPLAIEGSGLKDKDHVAVASTSLAFACALQRLYLEPQVWEQLSAQGYRHVKEHYSIKNGVEHFVAILDSWSIDKPNKQCLVDCEPRYMPHAP